MLTSFVRQHDGNSRLARETGRPGTIRGTWRYLLPAALILLATTAQSEVLSVSEGTNLTVDVSPTDGSYVIDLLGSLWRVPARGGEAERLTNGVRAARLPRWSPDGREILYEADGDSGPELWRYDIESGSRQPVLADNRIARHGAWHPDGGRIVFAAERDSSRLDLWEVDVATGIEWRITSHDGDESAPAWSANGRHLAYVLHEQGRWHLVVRQFGMPAESLLASDTPLMAPSWRPDGTLITYLREVDGQLALHMLILSDPPLERVLVTGEDFFVGPVSWKNRDQFVYAANGHIRTRGFEDWDSKTMRFSAAIQRPETRTATAIPARDLPAIDVPDREFIVRAPRLYNGHSAEYRHNVDVIVRDGVIAAIESQADRGDATVLDIGDMTIMPGLIDVYSPMPAGDPAAAGARLLAFGVTTLATPDAPDAYAADAWHGETTPGPLLLRIGSIDDSPGQQLAPDLRMIGIGRDSETADDLLSMARRWQEKGVPVIASNWRTGLGVGADLLSGSQTLPTSPQGRRYADVRLMGSGGPVALLSGLADAATPGLGELLASRQAQAFRVVSRPMRRFTTPPGLVRAGAAPVVGSHPSGLPAGLSTQAELRALQAAGLSPAAALHAATGAAARVLGADEQIGLLAAGARADLLLVDGDPLADSGAALDIVAVVRNGRFYSLSNLLERANVD
ncbi:MAG: amidohydrolase family protein [Woeseia sp.]